MAEEDVLDTNGGYDDEEEENIEDTYLTFNVNDELYAVGIIYVIEIGGVQNIVEVPDVPKFIKGVINLRGKVISVMDVRLRFHMPEKEYDDRTCIIVLEVDDVATGLVVDGVNEVIEIQQKNVDPPPSWQGDSGHDGTVLGMGKHEDNVSIILDVRKLLYDKTAKPIITAEKEVLPAQADEKMQQF